MITLLLTLLSSVAQAGVTSATVTDFAPNGGSTFVTQQSAGYGFGATLTIVMDAPGDAWTVNNGTCSNLLTSTRSGTGSATIRIFWRTDTAISAGQNFADANCTFNVSGTDVLLTNRTWRAVRPAFVTDWKGQSEADWTALGCTKHNSVHLYPNICPLAVDAPFPPNVGAPAMPAVGASWCDTTYYGGCWKRLATNSYHTYAGSSMVTITGKWAVLKTAIVRLADTVTVAGGLTEAGCIDHGAVIMSRNDPDVFWCQTTARNINKYTISDGGLTNNGVIYTHTHDFGNITESNVAFNGGVGDADLDNWVFAMDKNAKMNVIDLENGVLKASADYPEVPAGGSAMRVRQSFMAARPVRGYKYGLAMSDPFGSGDNSQRWYRYNIATGLLELVNNNGGRIPTPLYELIDNAGWVWGYDPITGKGCTSVTGNKRDCIGQSHGTGSFWFNGGVGRCGGNSYNNYNQSLFAYGKPCADITRGDMSAAPLNGLMVQTSHTDDYAVCATNAPVCAGDDQAGSEIDNVVQGAPIQTATGDGSTVTMVARGPHQLSAGQTAYVANASVSAMNGWFTVATVGTTAISAITAPGGTDVLIDTSTAHDLTTTAWVELTGCSITALNGRRYITVVDSDTFYVQGTSGVSGSPTGCTIRDYRLTYSAAATGTSTIGGVTRAAASNGYSTSKCHYAVYRTDNGHIRLISKCPHTLYYDYNMSVGGDTGNQNYNRFSQINISPSGETVLAKGQFGQPGFNFSTSWASETGFDLCPTVQPNDFDCRGNGLRVWSVTDTTAVATVTTPYVGQAAPSTDGQCYFEWGVQTDYGDAAANRQTLSGGSNVRTYTMTGLTAGQRYYGRAWCDGRNPWGVVQAKRYYGIQDWSQPAAITGAAVQFAVSTAPSPASTTEALIEYGSTPALSSSAIISCSAGSRCYGAIPANRNQQIYWRYTYRESGSPLGQPSGTSRVVLQ